MNIRFEMKDKKDIFIAGIIFLILILLFQFIYLPKSNEVKALAAEYKRIKKDIDELYHFVGGAENMHDKIINIRKGLVSLEEVFPGEKDVSGIIRGLNEKAIHFKINVISLKPKNFEIAKDNEGKELKIAGYYCKEMPLTLSVESRYHALGRFLMDLETDKSPLISIEKVEIKKDEDMAPRVKGEIELTTYILGD